MKKVRGEWLKSLFLVLFLVFFLSVGLYAADIENEGQNMSQGSGRGMPPQAGGPGQKEMKAPPQQAIDVCVGKETGDVCQCQGPQGDEDGVCGYTPDNKYFACKPNSMGNPDKKPSEKPEAPGVDSDHRDSRK